MAKRLNTLSALGCAAAALVSGAGFDYDRSKPLDVQTVAVEKRNGIEVRDITFADLKGSRTPAYLIVPQGKPKAAILFVHWYEPPNPTSNRTQFVDEAVELAQRGAVSLLPATMWSEPEWFRQRKREDDLENSLAQTRELRRAIDVLLAQPGANPQRLAFVGHDFGAMFGAVLAGVDGRPRAYALQAGTTSFTNWYLFGPPMKEPARSEFIRQLSILDPVAHIGKASPWPVLLQFATRDFYVSHAQAEEFWQAAREPKSIIFYDAHHAMNAQARIDRVAWLIAQLKL